MTDYIERNKALSASKIVYIEYIELDDDGYEEVDADNIPIVLKKDIEAIPAADVKPVLHGEWISQEVEAIFRCRRCSCCNEFSPVGFYCYNCGADMKTDNEESVNNET